MDQKWIKNENREHPYCSFSLKLDLFDADFTSALNDSIFKPNRIHLIALH